MSKLKLVVLYAKSGCDFWRVWLPCEAMRKQGLAEVRYIEVRNIDNKELAANMKWCDLAILRGLATIDGLTMLRRYKGLGVRIAVDYDDLFYNVSPFNNAYKNFGTEEIKISETEYLWQDGVDGFSIKRNKVNFHAYKAILQEADLITTPSLYLKQALAEISEREDNIRLVPNAIDLNEWKPLDVRDKLPGKFRFGWAISSSHTEDFVFIKSVIEEFLAKHTDAVFVCIGDTQVKLDSTFPKDQFEWYPFSTLWEYHYPMRMAMLGLDCAIAPLADTEFNKCKSPLKFAEYTAFGWPVIAQNMTPYSDHIVNGETGLLAKTKEDWLRCLETMYSDASFRAKLKFNAQFVLKDMFDLEKVAKEWQQIYLDAIDANTSGVTILR